MDFLPEHISRYAEQHTRHEGPILAALEKETYLKVLMPRMCSGHLQGQILRMFAAMIRPRRVLEIGTYTGYSAIAMAEVLAPDAELHTIDINPELRDMVETYVAQAGLVNVITLHIGNAMNIIPTLGGSWDMVFIDADKENYLNYFHLVLPMLRLGGYIIADNVLWSGKVCEASVTDAETNVLRKFNDYVHSDHRVENVLLPVRDGLMVLRKVCD